jgi:hypothetical protein
MTHIEHICFAIVVSCCLFFAWTLQGTIVKNNTLHEENIRFAKIYITEALDERNLAQAHVRYMEEQVNSRHKSSQKALEKKGE